MPRPLLEGVRVVELSQLIAAPFCGLTLGDLGAEVVKVESAAGDPTRGFPPYLLPGESAFFHALNRGKRGVALDLAEPRGRELAAHLIASADVVVENLGDAAGALGVTYERGAERNPRLVWCSITGWGHGTPGRAVDPSLQAATGLIELTGEPDRPPVRVPVPLVDLMTGMYAALSVVAALWRAHRDGRGEFLDCAMVDAAATLTSTSALLAWGGHLTPRRLGSESPLVVPSGVFEAADGRFVQIVCISERHWRGLCRALGHPEWAGDPRFADLEARLAHRDLVHGQIGAEIAREGAEEWVGLIAREGAICELVRDIEEAWSDPRMRERGLVGRLAEEGLDALPLPVVSLTGAANPDALPRGPALGEHTEAIARELRQRPA